MNERSFPRRHYRSSSVNIPVYAIGGINADTAKELKSVNRKNFAGVCVMSLLMQSENINDEVMKIKRELG